MDIIYNFRTAVPLMLCIFLNISVGDLRVYVSRGAFAAVGGVSAYALGVEGFKMELYTWVWSLSLLTTRGGSPF